MGTSKTSPPSVILRGTDFARKSLHVWTIHDSLCAFWFGVKPFLGVLWFIRPDGPKKDIRWDVNPEVKVPLLRERALHLEIGRCGKLQVCTMQCWYDKQKMVNTSKSGARKTYFAALAVQDVQQQHHQEGIGGGTLWCYDRWASLICSKQTIVSMCKFRQEYTHPFIWRVNDIFSASAEKICWHQSCQICCLLQLRFHITLLQKSQGWIAGGQGQTAR